MTIHGKPAGQSACQRTEGSHRFVHGKQAHTDGTRAHQAPPKTHTPGSENAVWKLFLFGARTAASSLLCVVCLSAVLLA